MIAGRLAGLAPREPRNRAQGRPVKVVEVRVRNQHRVNRRQLPQLQSGTAQPLENENPTREVGVNQDVLAPDLEEEAGMSDEGYAQLATTGEYRPTWRCRCEASWLSDAPKFQTAWPYAEL